MLRFVSWPMVSFSFLYIVKLIFFSVCSPTTGYIVCFFLIHLIPLLSNYDSMPFFFTTGRGILFYSSLVSISLSANSLLLSIQFYCIGYMSPLTHNIPTCSITFYTYVYSSTSSLPHVLYSSFLICAIQHTLESQGNWPQTKTFELFST